MPVILLHCNLILHLFILEFEKVRHATTWPTFVLATSGPWIAILGAVFTDGLIIQRLTDYVWVGIDSALNEIHNSRVAKIFYALRNGLENLKSSLFFVDQHLPCQPGGARLLQVPGLSGKWSRLHNIPCTDALYTSQGYRCQFCPALRRKGTPPAGQRKIGARTSILRIATPRREGADIWPTYASLSMVVMEFVDDQTLAELKVKKKEKERVRKRLREALDLLHHNGLVYGDLRPPNVVITTATRDVKIIDFDWAGEERQVKYPCLISMWLGWPGALSLCL